MSDLSPYCHSFPSSGTIGKILIAMNPGGHSVKMLNVNIMNIKVHTLVTTLVAAG